MMKAEIRENRFMKTIGIDIGGTQLRAAVIDENYNIIETYKTKNDRTVTCEGNMDKLISFILSKKEEFKGIGIGCPGPLNLKNGSVIDPPNLIGWDGFEIVKYVREKTGMRVELNNDANCAGLAEALLGKGKGYESVCFMGLSTGLGGAYVYQGKLVNGAHGNAAEWWNMMVNDDPYGHKNANPGSLNEQSAGSGLQAAAERAYGRSMEPKELFELYYKNDEKAVRIIERGVNALARGIANVTCVIDPDVIIVGGSIAIYHPLYMKMAIDRSKQYLLAPESLHVEPALFGDDAGLVGAALLLAD